MHYIPDTWYFWVCISRKVDKLWDIQLCHKIASLKVALCIVTSILTQQTGMSIILSHLNILHISCYLISYRIWEKCCSRFIFQLCVCMMKYLKVNDQTYLYTSLCCCRWNIIWITLNTYFVLSLILIINHSNPLTVVLTHPPCL